MKSVCHHYGLYGVFLFQSVSHYYYGQYGVFSVSICQSLWCLLCFSPTELSIGEISIGRANVLSLALYSWLTPLVWRLYRRGIGSILSLSWMQEDTTEYNVQRWDLIGQVEDWLWLAHVGWFWLVDRNILNFLWVQDTIKYNVQRWDLIGQVEDWLWLACVGWFWLVDRSILNLSWMQDTAEHNVQRWDLIG